MAEAAECQYDVAEHMQPAREEDWLVVALKAGPNLLSSSLEGYHLAGELYLPVDGLAYALDVSAAVDGGHVKLSLPQDQCPDVALAQTLDDGFTPYLSLADWQGLLEASLTFDYSKLLLTFASEQPQYAPLMARKARSYNAGSYQFEPDLAFADGYKVFTPPSFYLSVNSVWNEADDSSLRVNTTGVADLLYHSVEWNIRDTENSNSQRLKFFRENAPESSFPLGISNYSFGDISTHRDNLVHSSASGLGIKFGSEASGAGRFRRLTVDLNVPSGWRAELFRGNLFLSSSVTNDDGRLIFEDVDLLTGVNDFTIKLYNPQGDIQELSKTVYVDGNSLNQGELGFEGFLLDRSEHLIDAGNDAMESNLEGRLSLLYGLSDSASLGIGVHQLSEDDSGESRRYLSGRFLKNFASIGVEAETVLDDKNGQAWFMGMSGRFGGVRINSDLSWFDRDFDSELQSSSNPLRSELNTLFSGSFSESNQLGWRLNSRYSDWYDADDNAYLNGTLYKRVPGGSIQGSLIYNSNLGGNEMAADLFATQLIGKHQYSLRTRLDPVNDWELQSLNGEIRWRNHQKFFMNTRVQYAPDRLSEWSFSHGLNWRHDYFNLNFSVGYNHDEQWAASVGVSTALDFSPFDRSVVLNNQASRYSSRIHARAYVDNNRNRVFDEGDEGLEDVSFRGNRRWHNLSTSETGDVLLVGASPNAHQKVEVDLASIDDPYLQPVVENAVIKTHPGGMALFEVPLQIMNEVEGSVYFSHNGMSRAQGGVPLTLISEDNRTVATTVTEMDGYYLFSQLAPGKYKVKIDPDYLVERSLKLRQSLKPVITTQEGGAQWLPDLVVERFIAEPDVPPEDREKLTLVQVASVSEASVKAAGVEKSKVSAAPARITQDNAKRTIAGRETPWMLRKIPRVYPHNFEDYYVQLGLFNSVPNMDMIRARLPDDEYELHVFRNHETGQSYVVAGPYRVSDQAHKRKQAILDYSGNDQAAFVVRGNKFSAPGFAQEVVPKNLPARIRLSHQRLVQAPDDAVVCQLGSYARISSQNIALLEQHDYLSVIKRQVNGRELFTVFGGPFLDAGKDQCAQLMALQQADQSWSRSAGDLKGGLMPLETLPEESQ
ncbi:SdrD B-like domain-containing protein [Candidatus Pelagadaptatus aseana]|uniref:SPOR domain-containing protein n=1 Tax=Candidatus Pelagadaptatus aseana TaxID=3120508 RepID=UPI003C6F08E0